MATPRTDNPATINSHEPGYRERSLWASLAAVALVDTGYFFMVLRGWLSDAPLTASGLIALLVAIVVVLLLIEVGFVIRNRAHREPRDERDELIAAESARVAYWVFVCGVVFALGLHLLNAVSPGEPLWGLAVFSVPLFEVHLILATLVSAELVRYAVALLRYRRGY